jgi:hypothetical protein
MHSGILHPMHIHILLLKASIQSVGAEKIITDAWSGSPVRLCEFAIFL